MCKIYTVTGPLPRKAALAAVSAAAEAFTFQRDGFGFLAASSSASARGRYIDAKHFIGWDCGVPESWSGKRIEDGNFPVATEALLVHGRTSTNVPGVDNAHPFKAGSLHLVHNGVLDWIGRGKQPEPKRGCDSQQFLNWLAGGGKWSECRSHWSGYGALIVHDAKLGTVTVAKCGVAQLYAAKREKAGWVFSTVESDLADISKAARIKLRSKPVRLPAMIVTIGPDGEIIESQIGKFGGFVQRKTDEKTTLSLGRTADLFMSDPREPFPDYDPTGEEPQRDAAE